MLTCEVSLLSLQKRLCVSDYMPKQTEINERMRSILIDWLIQVHGRFGLLQETLYLTVCLIDRFLQVLMQCFFNALYHIARKIGNTVLSRSDLSSDVPQSMERQVMAGIRR